MTLSLMSSSTRGPIDRALASVLLANMLETWLDAPPELQSTAEGINESEDQRTPPKQTRLHLPAPINSGSNPPPPGEHRAAVCLAAEGPGTGLERSPHSDARRRSGDLGGASDRTHGFQDPGCGCFDGTGGSRVRLGSFPAGRLECRLVSTAGTVCTNAHAGDRRRWLLRSRGLQRRTFVRDEGHHGTSGTALPARAPPGRQTQQSQKR